MPVGPDTDRQGSGRASRDIHWEETTGAGDYGQGGGSEFRHMGEDFEYIVRHEPEAEGHGAENPWVASIFDDSGRYSPVSGRLPTLGDAKSMAEAYHANEWYPGSEKDLQNPNNPDYVAEGTEGQGLMQMAEGVGDILLGGIDVATHPLTVGAAAGYYGAKKRITGSFGGKVSKGRNKSDFISSGSTNFRPPPDDDPLADDPRTKSSPPPPPPPLGREGHPSAPTKSGPLGRSRPRNRPPDPPPFDLS